LSNSYITSRVDRYKNDDDITLSIYKVKENFFQGFCDKVILADSSIRFIGIADEHGRLLATRERKGLKPLLNMQETEQYAITAAARQYTRIRWQSILGKIDYTCSHYDKLLRATIPITDENNRLSHIIILTLDVETDNFHEVIMNKIVPLVRENTSKFLETISNEAQSN
jgi:hypothetical protein